MFVMEAQCTFHEVELKFLSFLLPKKEKWQRYKTTLLSVCESVRVTRFKLFSPLTDLTKLGTKVTSLQDTSRVRFSFLQSTTRRGGMQTSEAKETLTSLAEIMHSNRASRNT